MRVSEERAQKIREEFLSEIISIYDSNKSSLSGVVVRFEDPAKEDGDEYGPEKGEEFLRKVFEAAIEKTKSAEGEFRLTVEIHFDHKASYPGLKGFRTRFLTDDMFEED